MTEAPSEKRISVRIEPEIVGELQALADRKYEGRLSMVVREALRRIISDHAIESVEKEPVAA